MKKEILVFIFNGYADWEPAYVCAELNSSDTDYIVRTISLDKNPKVSMGGFHVLPDYSIADYPANFSLLILAENGFLNEIKHSGNTLEFMKSQAPHYKGDKNFLEEQAVCDANIITANGSGTLEFAKKILTLLNAKSEQAITDWYNLNKYGFYQ